MSNALTSADGITSAEGRLLSVQMGAMRDDVREVKDTMRDMARSLEQLVRIEEQQKDMRISISRAFDEIKREYDRREGIEVRMQSVERELPGLREIRKWVVLSIVGALSSIGLALLQYFVQSHVR